MSSTPDNFEKQRLALQAALDAHKSPTERNRLGQFATPPLLARDVVQYGLALLPATEPICFLDPAFGTGSFYSALRSAAADRCQPIKYAQGIEFDPHYGEPAKQLWAETPLDLTIADFTQQDAPVSHDGKANLLICNPPYVRHHHLNAAEKVRLQALAKSSANIKLSGLAGLYCYFMGLSHQWLADGGVAGWLIPSEFMDVNYGRSIKHYLLHEVSLLHVHRFDPNDVQFDDALVSSAVVWFRKEKPPTNHQVLFSYGGTLQAPVLKKHISVADLEQANKWTRFPKSDPVTSHQGYKLGDLFAIKRGVATGGNAFFILDEQRAKALNLPIQFLRPVMPSSRHLRADEIQTDIAGLPLLEKRLFLLDCPLPEDEVRRSYPALWEYLRSGLDTVAKGYLCRNRRLWYAQENRQAAPVVCTYMGRSDHSGKPFRFILNHSRATATNVYLMLYPQPLLASQLAQRPEAIRDIWQTLNNLEPEVLLGNGRVYGGGLHKLEPKELANVPADDLAVLAGLERKTTVPQHNLFEAAPA